jgi:hypothetical protein
MRSLAVAALVATLAPPGLAAQGPPPETAKLGYFEGTWHLSGEDQKGPMGPGGKTSGTEKCEWFEGRFAMVCRADVVTPGGPGKSMSTYTYNIEKKKYSFDGIDSYGADISATAVIRGGAWHWTSFPMSMPDGSYLIKYDVTPVSDREYAYTWSWSRNKGAWHPGGAGRATKK